MKTRHLPELSTMPLVIEPARDAERSQAALLEWAQANRTWLDETISRIGALLFRGFAIDGAEAFSQVSSALGSDLQAYVGGDSPRSAVADRIYVSTEFPPHLPIGLHNELSYAGWYPSRIFFHCLIEPKIGGQTPIGDSRRIYREMPTRVRERFEQKGVCYVQNLHNGTGPGKSWQQTFETDDPAVVEAYCRKHGMDYTWTDYGLRTRIVRQGVIRHPRTGEMAWFNQAEHFHASLESVRFWDVDPTRAQDANFPAHCTYGDGTEITREELESVRAVTTAAELAFDWRQGDVMMLDNYITAHGRRPYQGARKILVAMS